MTSLQTSSLPSMPGAVIKLLQMFADPEVCMDDVVETIKSDAALTCRILKAANSSTVAASREVSDLKRAAMLLGKKTVSTLALSFSLADRSMPGDAHSDLFKSFWNKSLITGVSASVLSKRYGGLQHDEAFLVGLLSGIGRLGALSFAIDEFASSASDCVRTGTSIDTIVLPSMGMSCEELTLQYMRAWTLPKSLIDLVESMQESGRRDRSRAAEHVRPSRPNDLNASNSLRVAACVGQFVTGENTGVALATVHELMADVLTGSADSVDSLIAKVLEEVAAYGEMLDADVTSFGSPAELHAHAMTLLTEILLTPESEVPVSKESVTEMDWLNLRFSQLTEQLTLDSMTNIYNRSYFDMQLGKRIAIARLTNKNVAVLFVDINEFKQVNDVYGHDVGDVVICSVANSLKAIVRKNDVVARYGGDEFVLLCEMLESSGLDAQAQRISVATANLTAECREHTIRVSLAIGGAVGVPDSSTDFGERLLRSADEAMYEAKQSRCNPVVRIFQADLAATNQPAFG
jgi:two-component system cell cycle response regulator